MIRRAKNGDPVDQWIPDPVEDPGPSLSAGELGLSALIAAVFGGTLVGGMKRQMKTAVRQTRAENYVAQGGVKLSRQDDQFVNRHTPYPALRRSPNSSSMPGIMRGSASS